MANPLETWLHKEGLSECYEHLKDFTLETVLQTDSFPSIKDSKLVKKLKDAIKSQNKKS